MGGASGTQEDSQALASKIISVAEGRQDALAFISPGRSTQLTETTAGQFAVKSDADITTNVVNWYSPVPSSSYAIFDSGYKYMYDSCLLYTSPSPRDRQKSRMPSSA